MWGAKVKGFKGSKFIGHFKTEEEAYNMDYCHYLHLSYLAIKHNLGLIFINFIVG